MSEDSKTARKRHIEPENKNNSTEFPRTGGGDTMSKPKDEESGRGSETVTIAGRTFNYVILTTHVNIFLYATCFWIQTGALPVSKLCSFIGMFHSGNVCSSWYRLLGPKDHPWNLIAGQSLWRTICKKGWPFGRARKESYLTMARVPNSWVHWTLLTPAHLHVCAIRHHGNSMSCDVKAISVKQKTHFENLLTLFTVTFCVVCEA